MNNAAPSWIQIVALPPPTLQDNTADADRLINALKPLLGTEAIHIDLALLHQLPDLLRKYKYKVRCILFKDRWRWLVIAVTSAADRPTMAGLAVDLGTSRVVLRLVSLSDGHTMAESDFNNPQLSVGPDILTRIHHADSPGGLKELNELIITRLNRSIVQLCRLCRLEPEDVYILSLAGNTAMTHLFMGLNPRWIIREPYIPVINKPETMKACQLGIQVNPLARIFIFPNVGSYCGGDLIAGILFSGLDRQPETAILVDMGTNAEVVLGNENWMIACAGAAGPALEGGVAQMGMMAGPGVVDRISLNPDTTAFDLHTIDDQPPRGICGSGLIDLAAQLYLAGMIDIRGKFVPAVCGGRLKEIGWLMHLVVIPADQSASGSDLTISQAELDSLIRSKAAMYTILETITTSLDLILSELATFYVAGTFGSFIDPRSAITIGLLPDLPLDRYKPLGNSSLGGAAMVLTSVDCLQEIDRLSDRITYMELNVNQEFMNRFSAAKFLPHTDTALFPSVKLWQKN